MPGSIPYQACVRAEIPDPISLPTLVELSKMVQGLVVLMGYILGAGLVVLLLLWQFGVLDVPELISGFRSCPPIEAIECKLLVWRENW